jgi:hypothetical protein
VFGGKNQPMPFDVAKAKQEVADRNRLRADHGLPLLSVATEVCRMRDARLQRDYEGFLAEHHDGGQRVRRIMLARARKARNDADWLPRSFLNGGGIFQQSVEAALVRFWRRDRNRPV